MPSNALESGAQIFYAAGGAQPDRTPAPVSEVTHVNWRPANPHEAAVIAEAYQAARESQTASLLGGLIGGGA